MAQGELHEISFQLGQMQNQITNLTSDLAKDRIVAAEDRKAVGIRLQDAEDISVDYKHFRKQVGLAIIVFSSILFGAFHLILSGLSYFGTEIKAGIRAVFTGH